MWAMIEKLRILPWSMGSAAMVLVSVASPRYRSVSCVARLDSTTDVPGVNRLRVLVANERQDRLAVLAQLIAGLGHEVIAPQIEVGEVGPVTAREHPDVAFVGLGESSEHALELIEQIVHEA